MGVRGIFFSVTDQRFSDSKKSAQQYNSTKETLSLPSPLLRTRLLVVRSLARSSAFSHSSSSVAAAAPRVTHSVYARVHGAELRTAAAALGPSSPLLSSLEVNPLFVSPPLVVRSVSQMSTETRERHLHATYIDRYLQVGELRSFVP